jgi:hypothetical protein
MKDTNLDIRYCCLVQEVSVVGKIHIMISIIQTEIFTFFTILVIRPSPTRERTFEGAFHMNPDYMHWYGWAPMKETLQKIKDESEKLRAERAATSPHT